jgi:T5SS/PEP-CTERM-associated repeat protein
MQATRHYFPTIVVLISLWAGLQPVSGQYTSNYQTNTISGVASYWTGDYLVGSNTLADVLLIKSGGALTTADGYVGYLAASVSNSVMVAGAGSVWTNGFMYFGYDGAWNTMVISNAGSVVETGQGTYVGYDTSSSSNRVLVTGTNSVWNCAGHFFMGNGGSGNSLVITNGGSVVSGGVAYLGELSVSSNNTALVTGSNSLWSSGSLLVGDNGINNKLTINKGGRVVCSFAQLGYFGSASGNSVWVSDTNSVWDVSASAAILSVGLYGSGNSVVVTNGAQLLGYYVYLGNNACNGNSMVVTGPGSKLAVNCYVFTGNQGSSNSFTLANGATVSDKFCYIGYVVGSSNNTVLLSDPKTSWQNSYSVFVGMDGVAGSLTISNGATMSTGGAFATSHDGALGVNADSRNNHALITGSGSLLNCADSMYVGLNGPGNNLVINNGGQIMDTTGYIGSNPGSDNNSALVAGTHSAWTNITDMYVGDFSLNNSLMISNGGWVFSGNGYVGRLAGSDSNSVMVTGAGSVWTNSAELYAGCYGSGNSLVISNGGGVSDDYGTVGFDTNSFNNQAIVDGTGSVWTNSTVVFVGDFGSTNSLTIRNGGLVTDSDGLIGEEDSSSGNTAYVQSGGVWRNDQLCVGDLGSENSMFVDGGSVFVTTYMAVGYDPVYYDNLCQLDTGLIAVTNQTHDAELEVYGGEFLLAGGTLNVDWLVVTNAGALFIHTGGTLIYRNLQLDPNQSVVGDGIPNWWKQQYGLDPFDPNLAGEDPDHDGMNNLQEYLAGTNPTNTASCLKITSVTPTNNSIRVSWSAVGGRSYVLQTNSDLSTPFADASPVITMPGTSQTVTNYLDSGIAAGYQTRFYRVRLGP